MNELQERKYDLTTLNSCDFDQLDKLGVNEQAKLGASSDALIQKVNSTDMGAISNNLISLMEQLNEVEDGTKDAGPLKKLFLKFKHKSQDLVIKSENLGKLTDNISNIFEKDQDLLKDGINALDKLKEATIDHAKSLSNIIDVAQDKLKQLDNVEIPQATEEDKRLNTIESQNKLVDLQSYRQELSRKIEEFSGNVALSKNTLVQANIVQTSQRAMYSKINQTLSITIPQMKQQLALAVSQNQLEKIIDNQKMFDESNNAIIMQNAKDFHDNSVAATKMINSTSVSFETIKNSTEEIRRTLMDITKINDEAEANRTKNIKETHELLEENKQLQISSNSVVNDINTRLKDKVEL